MNIEEKCFTIVVLNWNSLELLKKCLESLKRQTYRYFELICVDNGSSDGSKDWLQSVNLPEAVGAPAKTIFHEKNIGFAAGMNSGLREAKAKWVIPLNVDAFLAEDFLEKAAELFSDKPGVSMLGPKIFLYDNGPTNMVICTGVRLSKHFSIYTDVTADAEKEGEVFGPAGCCPVFVKKDIEDSQIEPKGELKQVYDELYFAYGEDVDLYLRMNLLGHHCFYSPKLVAYHAHSGTQEGIRWHTKDKATLKRLAANVFYTWLKNCPFRLLLKRMPIVILTPVLMSLTLLIKAPGKCLAPLAAYSSIIKNLPRTLQIRKNIKSKIKNLKPKI